MQSEQFVVPKSQIDYYYPKNKPSFQTDVTEYVILKRNFFETNYNTLYSIYYNYKN